MRPALSCLLEGLWLMRQAPGLYLALITVSAALNYYAVATPGWLTLGIVFSFFFYYWTMTLAARQVTGAPGATGGLLDFLQPRPAPLLGVIIYPFFAAFWAALISVPVWMLGSLAMVSTLGEGAQSDDPEQLAAAMTVAMQSGRGLTMIALMMLFSFLAYVRFLSNRITVPIIVALSGVGLSEADDHAGPRSGRRYQVLFWTFAIPSVPMWMLSLFIFRIIPPESGANLLFDLVLSFSAAWPLVSAVAFVHREIGPPPSHRRT